MTLTDIANLALEDVGARSVSNIDSDDFDARRIKRRIYKTIDDIAVLRNWTCLIKTVELVRSSTNERGESRFLVPRGLVQIIETYPVCEWRREGKEIVAHVDSLEMKCTITSYNPDDWDANFRGAVLSKLTADIVFQTVGNAQLAAQRLQLADRDIARYISNDVYAENPRRFQKKPEWYYPQ